MHALNLKKCTSAIQCLCALALVSTKGGNWKLFCSSEQRQLEQESAPCKLGCTWGETSTPTTRSTFWEEHCKGYSTQFEF